jgi:hypothetical protein
MVFDGISCPSSFNIFRRLPHRPAAMSKRLVPDDTYRNAGRLTMFHHPLLRLYPL